uniref:Mating pheromone 1 n=1 Tax=Euplotoides octocarinatus TaxID=2716877 RepID=MER1_EUPOC|nr:RecName: Full=Mating pheromone 1; Flags: Precursor [Euplotes octocarinatus]CAA75578.1 pheromone 1 [Euplotes octocarinatus]
MKAIFIILAILMVTQAFKMTSKVNTKLQSQIQSKFQSKNKLASTFQTSSKLKGECDTIIPDFTGCNANDACPLSFTCSATGNDEQLCNAAGQNVIDMIFAHWSTCWNTYGNCIEFARQTYAIYNAPELCGCDYVDEETWINTLESVCPYV